MNGGAQQKKKVLGIFSLVMITVGSVDSVRNLPTTALFGSQLVFFFIAAAIFFLIPAAFVSAELAAAWPEEGGVYFWIKQAFGARMGFLAIWLQWAENLVWYPTLLSFVAASLAYVFYPGLEQNRLFLVLIILISFWGATFVNLRGIQTSARFGVFCTLTGLLIPMIFIIGLGLIGLTMDRALQIDLHWRSFIPDLKEPDNWVALTGVILSYCGIEIATIHATDVHDPQRAFPRALLISVVIIVTTLILGSLAISMVLPHQSISLVAGIMQAFDAFFKQYHLQSCLPLMGLMLALGGIGSMNNWIIAPVKGLFIAGNSGHLPHCLLLKNRYGVPGRFLIFQAILVSLLSTIFIAVPSINGSYWVLTVVAAQLYMLMYIMLFLALIRLRKIAPEVSRPFKVPGGTLGLYFWSGLGILGCLVTILFGFIPPPNINVGKVAYFEMMIFLGLVLMVLPPLWQR